MTLAESAESWCYVTGLLHGAPQSRQHCYRLRVARAPHKIHVNAWACLRGYVKGRTHDWKQGPRGLKEKKETSHLTWKVSEPKFISQTQRPQHTGERHTRRPFPSEINREGQGMDVHTEMLQWLTMRMSCLPSCCRHA